MTWVRQHLSERAVIGQEQQAFGVVVEAAHREHAGLTRNKVHHCWPTFGIGCSGDDFGGFVEQVVDEARHRRDRHPIHEDLRNIGVDSAAENGDLAIYAHASIEDQVFAHSS